MFTRSLYFLSALLVSALAQAEGAPNLGVPMSEQALRYWDRSITPDGANLPPGSGSVADGKRVYEQKCVSCHGLKGAGQTPLVALVGGAGTLTTSKPVKSVGSYWPYATTLFDYIRRAMPYGEQKSLSDDEVYAVTAYTLFLNGIIKESAVITQASLPTIKMPNQSGFLWSLEATQLTDSE